MRVVLSATFAGSLFPRHDAEFHVHSVFGGAVNLLADGDPYPVALLAQSGHRHPRGAVVRPVTESLTAWGLHQGDRAALRGGQLCFLDGKAPRIDVSSAEGFAETMPGVAVASSLEARFCLEEAQQAAGTGLRLSELAEPRTPLTRRVADALALMTSDFLSGARLLVGLGEGLTPSGDDVLVGWMAAARCQGQILPPLNGLKQATNTISASFLDAAERGLFSAALVALAHSLTGGPVEASLAALASMGHSSGLDAATGLLMGLEHDFQGRNA